jgi:hypothetical protein
LRLATFVTAAATAACNADGTMLPLPDASADSAPEAAAVVDATTDAVPHTPVAFIRIANWSVDAPAVDLCLAPHGSGQFQGPLVGAKASANLDAGLDDGGDTLISFPRASAYVAVAPGSYDARLVVAGADGCEGILPDLPTLPPLADGAFATVALMGDLSPGTGTDAGLRLVGMQDEGLEVDPEQIAVRFVHAASNSPRVDMGKGAFGGNAFTPLFYGVSFGGAATPDQARAAAPTGEGVPPITVDDAGFVTTGSVLMGPVSVHTTVASFGHDEAVGTATAGPGSIVTIVLLPGPPKSVDSGLPSVRLLECVDNGRVPGPLSNCFVLSPP